MTPERAHGHALAEPIGQFPRMAEHVDDLCVIRSLHTEGIAHGPATLFLHTGSTNLIRPSMGAWVSYGLGSESQNLPGFVSICPAIANGGPRNLGTAFLPPVFQGTAIGRAGIPAVVMRSSRRPPVWRISSSAAAQSPRGTNRTGRGSSSRSI